MPRRDGAATGVDYAPLDAFKRACQRMGARTASALAAHGLREVSGTRGESAYLVEGRDAWYAHVEEGLGSKNLVADAMQEATGRCFYLAIGIDTVAAIVNDIVTCGALPSAVAMHLGVGDERWFADRRRAAALARGFAQGCRLAGAAWGGGETPALRGIVRREAAILAGSAFGIIRPKSLRIPWTPRPGDALVFLGSTGVQTNGLTWCRALARRLPRGYLTPIGDGRTFGEALLAPSAIYAGFVRECQRARVPLRYAVHVSGHGWRKLMRPRTPLVYRVTDLPAPPALFRFLMEKGRLSPRAAYGAFNMGVGFAVAVAPRDADRCVAAARRAGHRAWIGGRIERQGARKAVVIEPLGISYEGAALRVR